MAKSVNRSQTWIINQAVERFEVMKSGLSKKCKLVLMRLTFWLQDAILSAGIQRLHPSDTSSVPNFSVSINSFLKIKTALSHIFSYIFSLDTTINKCINVRIDAFVDRL